jgi:hypothetical protein
MSKSRLRTINGLIILLAVLLSTCACSRRSSAGDQAPDIDLVFNLQPDPAQVGSATLKIALTDSNGKPLEGANLSFRGDMTHAGMMPVLSDLDETDPGVYQADVEWTMAGAWILTIDGTLADGRILQRQIDLEVAP